MNEENCNTRRKTNKWYETEAADRTEEAVDLTPTAPAPKAAQQPDDGTPLRFKTRTPISLVDCEGTAMAHGNIIDDEPDVTSQELCGGLEPGHFKKISLIGVCRGWGTTGLQRDEIFDSDIQPFASKKRKLQELLADCDDGLYIWHEYVKPRIRSSKKVRTPSRKK
jgi:hypothetical protein